MDTHIQAILSCFCGIVPEEDAANEKQALFSSDVRSTEEIANELVQTIKNAEKGGKSLDKTLNSIVGTYGWTENLAKWTLEKLEQVLQEASKLKPVLKEALDKAWEAVNATEGFVKDHPIMCTVIALGVLVLVAPWALEALGFAELGPVEGSFAALWQARYAGYVPKGSLFSFFQRLGMVWH
ncbi:hypothetical protein EJ04DRAFT_461045 [Polyplosphaeria fusca]|uniref:Uncharacterized protein n=1 Tax=Polyplosphaeria fusca TaxID=682080 RepID=A0A9P4R5X2_9PLEO|nr:hypothetical protein EJ04DRAFT_461045 [Polyplosphaeria fusca]